MSHGEAALDAPFDAIPGACGQAGAATGQPVSAVMQRDAQRRWAACSIPERLKVIRRARHWMAAHPQVIAEAISPALPRSQADTLVAELLPLLDAMRFLERRAAGLLATRRLGMRERPLWLAGVQAEIERVPLGHVLVIGPSNFPLFLPGTHTMQALVAGNAVTWKPGENGEHVARLVAKVLRECGLPGGILRVTDGSVYAARRVLAQQPDKVIFTGSMESGRTVLHTLAESATPAVMELSGADAVVLLPSADFPLAAKAIAFGMRLNGAEVCMSPRRLIATAETMRRFQPMLEAELATVPPVALKPNVHVKLQGLLQQAIKEGASVRGELHPEAQRPVLVGRATSAMAIARADVFAPVLSLMEAGSVLQIPDLVNDCVYALTAAVFGTSREARAVAEQLRVGTVLVNDLIAPTADPRVPFSGRGQSGFGTTRGPEGLLEMTAAKTTLVRRKGQVRSYEAVGAREFPLFAGLIGVLHGGTLRQRAGALMQSLAAARKL